MKHIVLFLLIFLSLTSYSQNRIVKGKLISPIDFKLSGGLVMAEPSKNWTFIHSMASFKLECHQSDSLLTFHLFDRIINYKINTLDSHYIIEIDTTHSDTNKNKDNNEGFQIIISDVSLPMAISDYYFINEKGMWVFDQNMNRDSMSSMHYPVDTEYLESIKKNIDVIVDSIASKKYYNNYVDDGQEIIISILYKGELFEYTFQMYYNELINNLVANINSKVKESDKIEYEWTKEYLKK